MPGLFPLPFPILLRRMRREAETCGSIFDLPASDWSHPDGEINFSARYFSRRASTPVGPAAGPHTQLAQNIVLSWLAGGRIIELKTVQVNDSLTIPRPCIHVPNVGYNVEWSQELKIAGSLAEYAKAAYLIEILKVTRGFGAFTDTPGFWNSVDTAFDISAGYDLEGIKSDKVTGFLRSMRDAKREFEKLRGMLDGDLLEYRDIELPALLSDCVTLSTFHGCPPGQVEAMARYLLREIGVNVVIKFNPTLLGFETVSEMLIDRLGYRHLSLCREAFDRDLKYDDALELLCCLRDAAEDKGLSVGAKFTNTLVVANDQKIFPTQTAPFMYLSGRPLHVIAMNLMQRFREDAGFEFPISFSAGIDRKNFPAAVACGMVPVTTCTDLLRHGGYARLPKYLSSLAAEMRRLRVSALDAFVLAARGHASEAMEESLRSFAAPEVWRREGPNLREVAAEHPASLPRALSEMACAAGLDGDAIVARAVSIAGRLNGRDIVPELLNDQRYWAKTNEAAPRRIKTALKLYDCINCDLCISACPNDAMFAYECAPVETRTECFRMRADGALERMPGAGFVIRQRHQLAVVGDVCNECSNCDVYCPEERSPFKMKERVFVTLGAFEAGAPSDGFCRQEDALLARLDGQRMVYESNPEFNRAIVRGGGFEFTLSLEPFSVSNVTFFDRNEREIDGAMFWRMKTVWESVFNSAKPNMVNPEAEAQA